MEEKTEPTAVELMLAKLEAMESFMEAMTKSASGSTPSESPEVAEMREFMDSVRREKLLSTVPENLKGVLAHMPTSNLTSYLESEEYKAQIAAPVADVPPAGKPAESSKVRKGVREFTAAELKELNNKLLGKD